MIPKLKVKRKTKGNRIEKGKEQNSKKQTRRSLSLLISLFFGKY
jgi:hypothetical protein